MRPEEHFLGEKYILKHKIGQGGMGKVYLAIDRKLHKKWAVKEIDDTGKAVEAELMVLKKADHRNLPRIVDVLRKGNKIYIVMDYIEGESLKDRIARTGGLTLNEAIRCGHELADVLHYLHHFEPPIIYRDMKPSNIILRRDGSVVLVDFGTAKPYDGNCEDTTSLGTRDFASPEQFEGRSDIRSDIYALGRTLAECMPEKDSGVRIRSGRETSFLKILKRCTKKNPAKRYQTAFALRKDLEKLRRRKEGGSKTGILAGLAILFVMAAINSGNDRQKREQKLEKRQDGMLEEETFETKEIGFDYREQIEEILSQENISWEILSSILAQFSEDNQKLTDRKKRIQNAVFIAQIYVSYENHLEEALKKAAVVLRQEEAVWNREEDATYMEDRQESLLMLSTIFRMLGKREIQNRELYYRTSIDYTQEFLNMDHVREEKALYGRKVADMASMLEEIGDLEEARRYYMKWERDYPGESAEIYLSHMRNLMDSGAERDEMERLMKEAKTVEGMAENEQFKRMEKKFEAVYDSDRRSDTSYMYNGNGTGGGEFGGGEESQGRSAALQE